MDSFEWSVYSVLMLYCVCTVQSDVHWKDVTNIQARFLVTVGEPWNNCNATAATPYLKPDTNYTDSTKIQVGNCDHGPIQFKIVQSTQKENSFMVTVTFWTSVIAAEPPSCTFRWDGGYQYPTEKHYELSPLPGCYTNDSQEGYHPTDYMFHLLMWEWF